MKQIFLAFTILFNIATVLSTYYAPWNSKKLSAAKPYSQQKRLNVQSNSNNDDISNLKKSFAPWSKSNRTTNSLTNYNRTLDTIDIYQQIDNESSRTKSETTVDNDDNNDPFNINKLRKLRSNNINNKVNDAIDNETSAIAKKVIEAFISVEKAISNVDTINVTNSTINEILKSNITEDNSIIQNIENVHFESNNISITEEIKNDTTFQSTNEELQDSITLTKSNDESTTTSNNPISLDRNISKIEATQSILSEMSKQSNERIAEVVNEILADTSYSNNIKDVVKKSYNVWSKSYKTPGTSDTKNANLDNEIDTKAVGKIDYTVENEINSKTVNTINNTVDRSLESKIDTKIDTNMDKKDVTTINDNWTDNTITYNNPIESNIPIKKSYSPFTKQSFSSSNNNEIDRSPAAVTEPEDRIEVEQIIDIQKVDNVENKIDITAEYKIDNMTKSNELDSKVDVGSQVIPKKSYSPYSSKSLLKKFIQSSKSKIDTTETVSTETQITSTNFDNKIDNADIKIDNNKKIEINSNVDDIKISSNIASKIDSKSDTETKENQVISKKLYSPYKKLNISKKVIDSKIERKVELEEKKIESKIELEEKKISSNYDKVDSNDDIKIDSRIENKADTAEQAKLISNIDTKVDSVSSTSIKKSYAPWSKNDNKKLRYKNEIDITSNIKEDIVDKVDLPIKNVENISTETETEKYFMTRQNEVIGKNYAPWRKSSKKSDFVVSKIREDKSDKTIVKEVTTNLINEDKSIKSISKEILSKPIEKEKSIPIENKEKTVVVESKNIKSTTNIPKKSTNQSADIPWSAIFQSVGDVIVSLFEVATSSSSSSSQNQIRNSKIYIDPAIIDKPTVNFYDPYVDCISESSSKDKTKSKIGTEGIKEILQSNKVNFYDQYVDCISESGSNLSNNKNKSNTNNQSNSTLLNESKVVIKESIKSNDIKTDQKPNIEKSNQKTNFKISKDIKVSDKNVDYISESGFTSIKSNSPNNEIDKSNLSQNKEINTTNLSNKVITTETVKGLIKSNKANFYDEYVDCISESSSFISKKQDNKNDNLISSIGSTKFITTTKRDSKLYSTVDRNLDIQIDKKIDNKINNKIESKIKSNNQLEKNDIIEIIKDKINLMVKLIQIDSSVIGLVKTCDMIDDVKAYDDIDKFLIKIKRQDILNNLLQSNYTSYVATATFLSSRIPRNELPNVQDIPYPNTKKEKAVTSSNDEVIGYHLYIYQFINLYIIYIDNCDLPKVSYKESYLDQFLLNIFRNIVRDQIKYKSIEKGIKGLLEEGRHYMLSKEGIFLLVWQSTSSP